MMGAGLVLPYIGMAGIVYGERGGPGGRDPPGVTGLGVMGGGGGGGVLYIVNCYSILHILKCEDTF